MSGRSPILPPRTVLRPARGLPCLGAARNDRREWSAGRRRERRIWLPERSLREEGIAARRFRRFAWRLRVPVGRRLRVR